MYYYCCNLWSIFNLFMIHKLSRTTQHVPSFRSEVWHKPPPLNGKIIKRHDKYDVTPTWQQKRSNKNSTTRCSLIQHTFVICVYVTHDMTISYFHFLDTKQHNFNSLLIIVKHLHNYTSLYITHKDRNAKMQLKKVHCYNVLYFS